MKFATTDGDLVIGTTSGVGGAGPEIPADLSGLPLERLRYVGGAVVDAATITAWHVGADGVKHAVTASGRQALTCAWNALLINDAGTWRVKTLAEQLLPLVKEETRRRIFAVASQTTQANLTAARAAGLLSGSDVTDYAAGVDWINAMRAKCAELVAAGDTNYTDDAKWPVVPASVVALAARF